MWVLNRGWWASWVILLAPGVVALVIGILDPSAHTSDDTMTLRTFGVVWILSQLLIMGVLLACMDLQGRRADYFRQHGVPGTATILAADTTGTTVNDMPQVELKLEIEMPGGNRYTITDRRCWNPLSLAGLRQGEKLRVLVDPRSPKRIMFVEDERE